jgi:surface polysaccharide O-acyltransferase-like enzyme
LWFINALIIGYLVLWLLLERKADFWLLPIAHGIIAFSLATNAYAPLLSIKTDKEFAMIVLSLPFLIYGYKASQTDFVGKHISILGAVGLIVAGFLVQTVEIYWLYKHVGESPHNQEFLFGTLFYAGGIFALALKLSMPHDTVLSEYGRKYSLAIYLYHPLIIALVAYVLTVLPAAYVPAALWLNPVLCVVLTVLLIRVLDAKAPRVFRFINGV